MKLCVLLILVLSVCAACNTSKAVTKKTKMNNPVTYFEIPVNDLDRAIKFYQAVFDYKLERTSIDGNEMALFPADQAGAGASGSLAKGDSYKPGKQGARIYFETANIDETMRKAIAAGGKQLYPKTSIGEFRLGGRI